MLPSPHSNRLLQKQSGAGPAPPLPPPPPFVPLLPLLHLPPALPLHRSPAVAGPLHAKKGNKSLDSPRGATEDGHGQYCAYRHFAADVERSEPNSLIVMFTAYFDDSGTDRNSDTAVAACYISTRRGWDQFVTDWDHARVQEGFDAFHMADFTAPNSQGHRPYCEWDEAKKNHVYGRLARIINDNKRIGIAIAIPKEIWSRTPERIQRHFGREHYSFAVRLCMMQILKWRKNIQIALPVRYVFDWEMNKSQKRAEIAKIFEILSSPANEALAECYGVERSGFSFEHKEEFKPLQAADILAWQMRSHMRKVWTLGRDEPSICHPGFMLLREDQEMDLGFMTEAQLNTFVKRTEEWEKKMGPFVTLYE
jgi:Protein of unknown function (DUF3800)